MEHRETDDDYHNVIAPLGPSHRLIECKDSIQWILQRKVGKRWLSQKYFTSREGVLRRVREFGLPMCEEIASLPDRYRPRMEADGALK